MATTTGPTPWRLAGVWWLALTAVAIAVFALLPYVAQPLDDLAADGSELAANYADRPAWLRLCLYAHMTGGGLALLLSPIQLSARIRSRAPRLHRWTGRAALAAIGIGAASGLVLAPHNLAGPVGVAGFGLLAVLWLTFAALGLRAIRRGAVTAHRRWALRAFALTYAAVTLRLWLVALVPLTGDFLTAYRVVPFLAWVPNLVVVELLLRDRRAAHLPR
ncbi:DUF2306 domain-containing protein [Actinokineospora sp. PR83]|uniref:DUF2306 domain-containing protein n=1 Tax=Actinokineospora sp. PR83 TaxID=2884908 RepID=UPI001F42F8AC|nr:DUF2306 domain-containing protein [Actinokineospora sp. PR83]MCG8914582.1 DUF2306 domain-containing protein [Actinokineospora sp. PR83]